MCVCLRRRGGTLGTSLNYKANWDVRTSTRRGGGGACGEAGAGGEDEALRCARVAMKVMLVCVCVDASVQSRKV